MCNCGKAKTATTYEVTTADGTKRRYINESDARRAVAVQGGTIRTVKG